MVPPHQHMVELARTAHAAMMAGVAFFGYLGRLFIWLRVFVQTSFSSKDRPGA